MPMLLKYLKSLLYVFIPILIFTILISIFNYFNILSNNTIKYFKLIIPILSFIIGGVYIGRRSNKKGWLEGIKVGGISLFIFLLLAYLGFDKGFSVRLIFYYGILLISSMLGSMIGINKRKVN